MNEKIFNNFRKVNNEKVFTFDGTGLGLSISKSFVKLLGGNIRVESKKGSGAAFYVTIPCEILFLKI